jgi:ribosomal protein S12 methylthiotransferase accessory factor
MELKIGLGEDKKVCATYKNFMIQTDQPKREGGGESAPAPFDLFLTSIGTCAGFYVLSFCQSRNISTEGIRLTLTTERGASNKIIDKVIIEIQLPPEFPKKYIEAVVKASSLCTVKKCIEDPPSFEVYTTQLK